MRAITSTYAYHPANMKPDLKVDTDIVAKYELTPSNRPLPIDPQLEWDIKQNGIKFPLQIYTNGISATLGDGNHRLRIARKLGIKKVPVQLIPDNFRRWGSRNQGGHPALHPVLAEWVSENLWSHEDHEVTRHIIGGNAMSSIKPCKWAKCECSCGARWKEEA